MKITRYALSLVLCFLYCSLTFAMETHQIGVTDPENCATITYSGSRSYMRVSLYKINNQVRTEYLEKTTAGSYNQFTSLGFSIQVPVGKTEMELVNLKSKEIVRVAGTFERKQYQCDFSTGYEIYEETETGERIPVALTIEQVPAFKEEDGSSAVLHCNAFKKFNPLIIRINNQAPSCELPGWNNFYFNNINKPFDARIPEGTNVIELGMNVSASGYSGLKYLVVQKIVFTAEKDKRYQINVREDKQKHSISNLIVTIDKM